MPHCQFPVFCYFCVSEKLHGKYSRNWMKQKPNLLIFTEASRRTKRRRRGSRGQPHHQGARPMSLAVLPYGEGALVHFWWCPFAYKDPQREKPKYPINFPETHRDPPPSSTRDQEGPEALPGTLLKREITIGGLLHRHACLRHDEWIVYLGLWVHSSS
jgi:hypothetical protein